MSSSSVQAPMWAPAQQGGPAYVGWSHRNQRLEMMDLPSYLESLQEGYQRLTDSYRSALGWPPTSPAVPASAGGSGWPWASAPGLQAGSHRHGPHGGCGCGHHHRSGRDDDVAAHGHQPSDEEWTHHHHHHGEEHGHRHRHGEHECGCHEPQSCRCDCCVEDADMVVYAHCGERRVIPISVDNETRRDRENVTVEVSEVRTAGGRVLPWKVVATPTGPLTLRSCSTTRLEVVVGITCGDQSEEQGQTPTPAEKDSPSEVKQRPGVQTGDVDECVVGYITLRLGGCVTRPIVVAVAVLPDVCDSYQTSCACSCC